MIWASTALFFLLAAPPPNDLEQAVKALESENFAQAAPLLEKVLAEDPENVEVRFNLAFAYSQTNQDGKAIELYQRVVEQKPELQQARMNLGVLLMRQNRAAEAAPHFEMLAQTRPGDFRAQFYYANALEQSGKLEQAIAPYEKAAALDPNSADAALGVGRLLARTGQFEKAQSYYEQAARIDPQLEGQMLELAELLEKNGREPQALALYQQYAAAHADAVAVKERIGMMLLEQKRYPEAVSALEAAVALSATPANRAALAEAYTFNNQADKALPAWRDAVEDDATNPALRLRYANALLAAQQFNDAVRNFQMAVQRDPKLSEGWIGLAFCLYKLENYPLVLEALSQLRALGGEKPASIFLAAITQDKLQKYTEAKASYERFLATQSGLPDEEFQARQRISVIEKILAKKLGK